jgi:hypothetical protein
VCVCVCARARAGLTFGDITKRLSTMWKDLKTTERSKVCAYFVVVAAAVARRSRVCVRASA